MPLPERHHFVRRSIRSLVTVSVIVLCGLAAGCETTTRMSQASQSLTAFQTDAQLRRVLTALVSALSVQHERVRFPAHPSTAS